MISASTCVNLVPEPPTISSLGSAKPAEQKRRIILQEGLSQLQRFITVCAALKFAACNSALDLLKTKQSEELKDALRVTRAIPLGQGQDREDFQDITILGVALTSAGFISSIEDGHLGVMTLTIMAALDQFEEFAKKEGFYDPSPKEIRYIEDRPATPAEGVSPGKNV